jgi:hypothetical protein
VDVRHFDECPYRGIGLLAGGFPCQPITVAGKQLGAVDRSAQIALIHIDAAAVPGSLRGQAFGLALGGMYLRQSAVVTAAGAAAGHVGPLPVIAVARAAGAAAAVLISVSCQTGLRPHCGSHRGPPISPSAVRRVGLSVGAADRARG